ncbi:MAG: hypothetical protein QM820_64075 [Minicystis sp.]
MKRGFVAPRGLVAASLLLAGACSEVRLIGDEQDAGAGAAPPTGAGGAVTTSTSSSGTGGFVPIDPDAAARAAVVLRSCGFPDTIDVILNRFYTHIPGPDDAIDRLVWAIPCIDASLGGCDAAKQCLGLVASANVTCEPGCTGTVLRTCDGNQQLDMDCATLGLTCASGVNRCLAAPLAPSCDPTALPDACNGSIAQSCNGFVVHGPDCASQGMKCGFVPNFSNGLCVGEGPACETSVSDMSFYGIHFDVGIACEGNTLRACVNRSEHQVDCTTLSPGLKCQTAGAASFCGLASECDPRSEPATCDPASGIITVCNAGRHDQVSCEKLGFTGGCDDVSGCLIALGGP